MRKDFYVELDEFLGIKSVRTDDIELELVKTEYK